MLCNRKEVFATEIHEIISYIDEHLQEDISLVELGTLAGYSPWHLYKLLKFHTGEPLASYIRKRRLLLAAQEIDADSNLLHVAINHGFETAAGFYKAFLRQFKCSPSEFRRSVANSRHANIFDGVAETIYENGVIEMGKVTVRKLQDEDAASLHEYIFIRNSLTEVEARVLQSLNQMEQGDSIFVVAIVDHNIVGALGLDRESHPLLRHRASLSDEVVNPTFNDMGIPALLFAKALEFAEEAGIKIITGSSRADYFTERFFKENNFTEIGRIPNGFVETWNNNKGYDEVLYYYTI